jgi:hypothetical protein
MLILGLLGMYFEFWCSSSICHQLLTIFKIGCVHTVHWSQFQWPFSGHPKISWMVPSGFNPSNWPVCFTQSSIPHLGDCSTFAHVYFFWVAAYVLIMLRDTCDSYEEMFGTSQEAVKVIYSSTINTVSILWPSPPGTFHISIGTFFYFIIRCLNQIFFVINFSYFVIKFFHNNSMLKYDNKIGKVNDKKKYDL